jgi:hypothetical protein
VSWLPGGGTAPPGRIHPVDPNVHSSSDQTGLFPMKIFSPQLLRSLGLGFILGAAMVAAVSVAHDRAPASGKASGAIIPTAVAAPAH